MFGIREKQKSRPDSPRRQRINICPVILYISFYLIHKPAEIHIWQISGRDILRYLQQSFDQIILYLTAHIICVVKIRIKK